MTPTVSNRWETMRTEETRMVEDVLREAGFAQVDVYRYNSASIRVRVVDPRFEDLSRAERDAMVEVHLDRLPEPTQADIISLITFAPSDLLKEPKPLNLLLRNAEFDDPSPSTL